MAICATEYVCHMSLTAATVSHGAQSQMLWTDPEICWAHVLSPLTHRQSAPKDLLPHQLLICFCLKPNCSGFRISNRGRNDWVLSRKIFLTILLIEGKKEIVADEQRITLFKNCNYLCCFQHVCKSVRIKREIQFGEWSYNFIRALFPKPHWHPVDIASLCCAETLHDTCYLLFAHKV